MRQDARMMKPYIMVGRKSNKGFNTTTIRSRANTDIQAGSFKDTVNTHRINRERLRHKLAVASFIPVPRLVKQVSQ